MSIVYLDGKFLQEEKALIPVMDRGFLFGDGVYTTIQVCEGRTLFLDTHLQRLKENCAHLHILPPTIDNESIYQLIEKNQATQGVWRLKILITGGSDPQMRLPERPYGHLVITLKPFTVPPLVPLRLVLFPFPVSICHASFKSLAHLNRYYVMEYACKQGVDDAVTTTESKLLLEASFGNLLWLDPIKKYAWTPSSELPLHAGVTLSVLKKILQKEGYMLQEAKWTINDIPENLLLFRVNTMSGIRPVSCLEERKFPQNPSVTTFLKEVFEEKAEIKQTALTAAACPV